MSSQASKQHTEQPSVARSTALMTVATLGSRATGLIRTWAMAFVLGNSFLTSSYQVANNMPNTIYELVVGGILGAAFIPVFLLERERNGKNAGNDFACNILNMFLIVLGVLTLLALVFAPQVIWTQTFAEGSSQNVIEYAVRLFRIFAIQILFYGLGGVITGILNANRVYFLPSLAPALNNLIVIAGFFAYLPLSRVSMDLGLNVLAICTSLGVVVQFAIQIPALRKSGFRYRWHLDIHDPALVEALKIALPTFLYIAGTMVSFSCRNAFSLQAAENGPSTLIYAWTWYQLPHGVVAVSLSRALFTEMSTDAAKGNMESLRGHVTTGIAGTLMLIIPLACLMGVLSTPLMQLFRAGAFSTDDVATVANVLLIWVISMPFYSVSMFMYNVFASVRKFHVFAIVSCVLVVVQVALYALLCPKGILGLMGVPIADLVYYGVVCIISIVASAKYIGHIGVGHILWLAARVLVASLAGGAVAWGISFVLPAMGNGMLAGLVNLVLCGFAGLVVSFGLCIVFRVREMDVITNVLRRFLPSKAPREDSDIIDVAATAVPDDAPGTITASGEAGERGEYAETKRPDTARGAAEPPSPVSAVGATQPATAAQASASRHYLQENQGLQESATSRLKQPGETTEASKCALSSLPAHSVQTSTSAQNDFAHSKERTSRPRHAAPGALLRDTREDGAQGAHPQENARLGKHGRVSPEQRVARGKHSRL